MDVAERILKMLRQSKGGDPDAIHQIKADDLLPLARQPYDEFIKRHNLASIPIFLDQNLDHSNPSAFIFSGAYTFIDGQLRSVPEQSYMVISEFNRVWTVEDLKKPHIQKEVYPDEPTHLPRLSNPNVLKQLRAMSQALNINPIPNVYVSAETGGSAGRTKDGHYYIILNSEESELEQTASLAHELGHVKKQHLAPENIVRRHNEQLDVQVNMNNEREADEIVANLCQGEVFAESLRRNIEKAKQRLKEIHPSMLPYSGIRITDKGVPESPVHPDREDRIEMLKRLTKAAQEAGTCPAPDHNGKQR